jgi:hypothetical protein
LYLRIETAIFSRALPLRLTRLDLVFSGAGSLAVDDLRFD